MITPPPTRIFVSSVVSDNTWQISAATESQAFPGSGLPVTYGPGTPTSQIPTSQTVCSLAPLLPGDLQVLGLGQCFQNSREGVAHHVRCPTACDSPPPSTQGLPHQELENNIVANSPSPSDLGPECAFQGHPVLSRTLPKAQGGREGRKPAAGLSQLGNRSARPGPGEQEGVIYS